MSGDGVDGGKVNAGMSKEGGEELFAGGG